MSNPIVASSEHFCIERVDVIAELHLPGGQWWQKGSILRTENGVNLLIHESPAKKPVPVFYADYEGAVLAARGHGLEVSRLMSAACLMNHGDIQFSRIDYLGGPPESTGFIGYKCIDPDIIADNWADILAAAEHRFRGDILKEAVALA